MAAVARVMVGGATERPTATGLTTADARRTTDGLAAAPAASPTAAGAHAGAATAPSDATTSRHGAVETTP